MFSLSLLFFSFLICSRVVEPLKARDDDLQAFHSSDYLSFLKAHNGHEWDELSPEDMEEADTWGLGG